MKIKTRMFFGVLGAIFFLVASNLIAQEIIDRTNNTIAEIISVNSVKIQLLSDLKNLSDERAILTRDLVIFEEGSEQVSLSKARLGETAEEISSLFKSLNKVPFNEKQALIIEDIRGNMVSANLSFIDFTMAIKDGFAEEAVEILIEDFQPKYQSFSDLVGNLKLSVEEDSADKVAELFAIQKQGELLIWSVLLVSVLLFSIVGWLVARSFLKPIEAMHATMQKIMVTGELNHQIEIYSKDELGDVSRAMNVLNARIGETITSVTSVVLDMSEGQFDNRITLDSKGDFLVLKNSVNKSMDQVQSVMKLLEETAGNLRQGNLEVPSVEGVELKGQFFDVMNALEIATLRIHQTVQNIDYSLRALAKGDFSNRIEGVAHGEFISLKDSINRTLDSLEQFVEEVAQVQTRISDGDLTQLVKGVYYGKMAILKDSLNSSVQHMSMMIAKVGTATQVVTKESDAIAQSSQEVASRIQKQSLSLEETAEQMEGMTLTVRNNAESALHTRKMTEESQVKLSEGVSIMEKAMASMDDMSEASQKINDIISIIDAIAFQTNLLALNAAVEAARAGEHGRGFAVVAGEVRNLAGKSADAASEIKLLIENSVRISNESGHYVKQTSNALLEINHSMDGMATLVKDITVASREQSERIDLVSQSVSEMDKATQQSAVLVKDTATGAKGLKEQSEELLQLVSDFKIDTNVTQNMLQIESSKIT